MSPRPRTVDDTTILEAAFRVISKIGPDRLTLADVGAEAGLSAATLVQRFGSKRELMLSILRHLLQTVDARFTSAMNSNESPLESLYTAATDRIDPREDPQMLTNRMAFYLASLDDPEFYALAVENPRNALAGYKVMVERAIAAGELTAGYLDAEQLAQIIHTTMSGSLLTWCVTRQGTLRGKIRRDLDLVLRPFRRGPRKATSLSRLEEGDLPERGLSTAAPAVA